MARCKDGGIERSSGDRKRIFTSGNGRDRID